MSLGPFELVGRLLALVVAVLTIDAGEPGPNEVLASRLICGDKFEEEDDGLSCCATARACWICWSVVRLVLSLEEVCARSEAMVDAKVAADAFPPFLTLVILPSLIKWDRKCILNPALFLKLFPHRSHKNFFSSTSFIFCGVDIIGKLE